MQKSCKMTLNFIYVFILLSTKRSSPYILSLLIYVVYINIKYKIQMPKFKFIFFRIIFHEFTSKYNIYYNQKKKSLKIYTIFRKYTYITYIIRGVYIFFFRAYNAY